MPFTTSNLYLGGQEHFNLGCHLIFTYSHFLIGHRYGVKSIYIILKGNIITRFRCTCHILSGNDATKRTLVSDEVCVRLCMFYDSSHKTLLLAGQNANLKLATSYLHIFLFIHFVSQLAGVGLLLGS